MTDGSGDDVVLAVLAAGGGSRLGRPKADLVLGGERLLDRAVRVAREAGCGRVLAVVRDGTEAPGAYPVVNPDPGRGMRGSLALAVSAAAALDPPPAALAVLLVDAPGVGAGAIRAVLGGWRPGRICVAGYGGRRGHPIVMDLGAWAQALRAAAPDEGARAYLAARPDLVDEIAVSGDPYDIDTPDDLARWTGP